jgi:hypothetical protein
MSESVTTTQPEADPLMVTINLRSELTPEELNAFLRNAEEAHRSPVEHFKALTIGVVHPKAA